MSISSHAKFMARTGPISFLLGAYNGEVNYAPYENLSFGVGAMSWEIELFDIELEIREYHLRSDYWCNGAMEQGCYLAGMLSRMSLNLSTFDGGLTYDGAVTGTGATVIGGYHWQWDHFMMELGALYTIYSFAADIDLEAPDGSTLNENIPALTTFGFEFNIGLRF